MNKNLFSLALSCLFSMHGRQPGVLDFSIPFLKVWVLLLTIDIMYGYCVNYPAVRIRILFRLILPLRFVVWPVVSRTAGDAAPRWASGVGVALRGGTSCGVRRGLLRRQLLRDCAGLQRGVNRHTVSTISSSSTISAGCVMAHCPEKSTCP